MSISDEIREAILGTLDSGDENYFQRLLSTYTRRVAATQPPRRGSKKELKRLRSQLFSLQTSVLEKRRESKSDEQRAWLFKAGGYILGLRLMVRELLRPVQSSA